MLALRLAQSLGSSKVGGGAPPPIPSNVFKFSVNTANAGTLSNQFQLPLVSNGAIDIGVWWGDGEYTNITSYNQAETLHTYASSGTYTVAISNEVRGWKFNNSGDKEKVLDISNWGEFNFTEEATFKSCSSLTCSATDTPTISTTTLKYTFYRCYSFNGGVSDWDVSSVTDMQYIFYNSSQFTGLGLGTWDVSSVTKFSSAFRICPVLNSDISGWNTSSAIRMVEMFNGATSFNQDISAWDINQVTNFNYFMYGVTLSTANYDALLVGWEAQAPSLNETPNFGNSQYTLGGAAEAARTSLISTYGWTITDGGAAPPAFTFSVDTTQAGTANNQFQLPLVSNGAISMIVSWGDGTSDTITSYNQAETLHTYASSGTYTVAISNEVRGWTFNNGGDKAKILDVSKWGEFNFTERASFQNCNANLNITATDIPTISSTDLSNTFEGMFNLQITTLAGWDVSSVSNFSFMFANAFYNLNANISGWNTSSATNMAAMLYQNTIFNQDLSGWDISGVTNLFIFLSWVGSLSTANYDALLVGWEAQTVVSGRTADFGFSKYTLGSAAATSRASLISSDGWTITDGGGI